MWETVSSALIETAKIILMVFALMIAIEFLELRFRDKIRNLIGGKPMSQYVLTSLLGAVPGCIDAFFVVSLYAHGLVGFGALAAVMLSTAGDDAFVMLAMIPDTALIIFAFCLILGVIGGFAADKISNLIGLKTSEPCEIEIHETDMDLEHFFEIHVYEHIAKKHIPKMFLWIFLTLLAVDYLITFFDLESILSGLPKFILIVSAALIGIIPESGPHLFFVILFSRGLIPFSVLLVNTLSQDGHGLLPLLSYSVKDTIYVQIFTTIFSLAVGLTLFLIGI